MTMDRPLLWQMRAGLLFLDKPPLRGLKDRIWFSTSLAPALLIWPKMHLLRIRQALWSHFGSLYVAELVSCDLLFLTRGSFWMYTPRIPHFRESYISRCLWRGGTLAGCDSVLTRITSKGFTRTVLFLAGRAVMGPSLTTIARFSGGLCSTKY